MTGNGNHTTYKNGDDWRMVYYCFTHITLFSENIYWYLLGITLPVARGITMDDWDSHFFKAYFFLQHDEVGDDGGLDGLNYVDFPKCLTEHRSGACFSIHATLKPVDCCSCSSIWVVLQDTEPSRLRRWKPEVAFSENPSEALPQAQQVFLCLPIFEHAMCLPCNILHHRQI